MATSGPGNGSQAENLVEARFADATDFANRAKKEITLLINELVSVAKAAAGINVDDVVPLTQPDVPGVAPFSEHLVSGATGIEDDTAIWQRGLDRAAEIFAETLDRVDEQFTGFSALPSETYYAIVQSRIDRYAWELSDLDRYETSKGFNVAAEFAKFITGQVSSWTLAMKGADARQAVSLAQLQLTQIGIEIREFLEKAGLELQGYVAAGDTAAHLAGAAMQAVSASASISDSGSDSNTNSVSTSVSNEVRSITSETTVDNNETSQTVITGDE